MMVRHATRSMLRLFCVVALNASVYAQTDADFGDFADPPIPTLRNSMNGWGGRVGPFHVDTSHEWIGTSPISTTTREPDAKPQDEEDGLIDIENIRVFGRDMATGQVSVSVTTDSDAAVRYLNVVADLNGDGLFKTYSMGAQTQYEWLVVNLPIAFQNQTKTVTQLFTLSAPVLTAAKVRVTLSTESIYPGLFGTNGWDGSGPAGGFARGETEDHENVPIVQNHYALETSGVREIPPVTPPPPWPPPNPPVSAPPVDQPPRGPVGPLLPEQKPLRPGEGLTPYTPETEAPERLDEPEDNAVVEKASLDGVPDIKQGPNECVPAATANSLSYLMNKAGLMPEDPGKFNKELFDKLKAAMKTSAENGTKIATDNPMENDFLKGKTSAAIAGALRNAKLSTAYANPSVESICDAIRNGYDVEIVITCYDKNGNAVARHMVTVVGFVKKADGTIELKVHDPNNRKPGDQPGVSANPPRESTLTIVIPPAGGPGKGGLHVKGLARDGRNPGANDDGDVFVIDQLFVERLAQGGAPVAVSGGGGRVIQGTPVRLTASAGKAGGLVYQWSHDDIDIEDGTDAVYEIEAAAPEHSGTYTCWVYDPAAQTWGISEAVTLNVIPETALPAASMLGALFFAGAVAWLAWRRAARG